MSINQCMKGYEKKLYSPEMNPKLFYQFVYVYVYLHNNKHACNNVCFFHSTWSLTPLGPSAGQHGQHGTTRCSKRNQSGCVDQKHPPPPLCQTTSMNIRRHVMAGNDANHLDMRLVVRLVLGFHLNLYIEGLFPVACLASLHVSYLRLVLL